MSEVQQTPWRAYTQLAAGIIMLIMSVAVFFRLWKGKRDHFTVILTSFTLLLSL